MARCWTCAPSWQRWPVRALSRGVTLAAEGDLACPAAQRPPCCARTHKILVLAYTCALCSCMRVLVQTCMLTRVVLMTGRGHAVYCCAHLAGEKMLQRLRLAAGESGDAWSAQRLRGADGPAAGARHCLVRAMLRRKACTAPSQLRSNLSQPPSFVACGPGCAAAWRASWHGSAVRACTAPCEGQTTLSSCWMRAACSCRSVA